MLISPLSAYASEVSIQRYITPSDVLIDTPFTLKVRIESLGTKTCIIKGVPRLGLPDGITQQSSPDSMTKNTTKSMVHTFSYHLIAKTAGVFEFPEMIVDCEIDEKTKTLKTKSIKFNVKISALRDLRVLVILIAIGLFLMLKLLRRGEASPDDETIEENDERLLSLEKLDEARSLRIDGDYAQYLHALTTIISEHLSSCNHQDLHSDDQETLFKEKIRLPDGRNLHIGLVIEMATAARFGDRKPSDDELDWAEDTTRQLLVAHLETQED